MDERSDRGEFYPGGSRSDVPPGTSTDKVDRVNLGEIGDEYTLRVVKQKVNQIVRAIAPAAVCLAICASAATVPLEDIPNTAPVVTNEEDAVAMAAVGALGQAMSNRVEAAEGALQAEIADATNAVVQAALRAAEAESNRVDATYAKRSEIPAAPDLAPYALKSELPQDYLTENDITNFATRAWINSQNYAREGTVYTRLDAQDLAIGAATNAQNAAIAAASNRVTAATNKLWQAMGSESNRLDSATNEVWQSALRADETLQREIDALRIVAADSNAVTRLVTADGSTWQDATGTVWQVQVATSLWTVVHSWTTNDVNWYGPWWWGAEAAGDDYYDGSGWYISSSSLTWMRMSEDPYASEIVVEWTYWGEEAHSVTTRCTRTVQWLTNAVDRVAYTNDVAATAAAVTNYTDAALGAFAATGAVARANVYGTPNRWVDATGCVWEATADKAPWTGGPSSPLLWSDEYGGWISNPGTDLLEWSSGTWTLGSGSLTTTFTCSGEWGAMRLVLHSEGPEPDVILERGLLTNLVGRVALTNDLAGGVSMDVTKTTDESKMLNAPSLQSARVVPDPVQSAYWPNRQRVLKLGDGDTVVSAGRAEADWLLVRDPSRLLFIDTMTVDGGETNYTFKTFQQYLNAVSPDTMQEIMRAYLPVEGGGTVTGDVTVAGDVTVTGTLAAPNLVRVVTADIEANGFSVSNGVLRANSGLVVSNGMCKINCARATIGIGTPRLHIEGSVVNATHNLTFGGEWDAPYFTFYSLMTNQFWQLVGGSGLVTASNATEIAAMPVAVPDYRSSGTSRINVMLENNRLNVLGDSLYRATVVLQCPRAGSVNTRFDMLLDFSTSVPTILLDFGTWGESPVFLGPTDALEPTAGTPRIVHLRCVGSDRWIVTYDDLTSWMPPTNAPEEEEEP